MSDIEVGQVFGSWTVVEMLLRARGATRKIRCRCSCGRVVDVDYYKLRAGKSLRCKPCNLNEHRPSVTIPPGTRYGLWEVLGEAGTRRGSRLLQCRCACGLERQVSYSSLTGGQSRGCKKCVHRTPTTLQVGQVVGDWAILAETGRRKGNPYFLCRCTCGIEEEVCYSSLRREKSMRCTRCSQQERTSDAHRGPIASIWKSVLSGAVARGISIDITQEQAFAIYGAQRGRCALTGLEIELATSQNKRGTASLDRIDSALNYTADNVQWVHKTINRMKNMFSQDYFIEMCGLVAAHAVGPAKGVTL